MNKQKQLWEKLAKENSRYYINSDKGKGITDEEFRDSGLNDFIDFINNDKLIPLDTTILEIGCGIGRMTEFMAYDWPEVIAVDISSEMIRQGGERLKKYSNIKFIETDGETLPVDDNSVDVVFSYLVFQHMKTEEMVEKNFREAHRVLRPGGVFKVLLRTDQQKNMEKWWTGVHYTEETAKSLYDPIGFSLIKLEQVKTYAMWLWLKKV